MRAIGACRRIFYGVRFRSVCQNDGMVRVKQGW